MTKLIIFEIPTLGNIQFLVNWAKLFRMEVEVRSEFPIRTIHEGYNILVTSDLFFKNFILSDVMQEKEIGFFSGMKKIKEKWYPSFCFATSRSRENPIDLFHPEMESAHEMIENSVPITFRSKNLTDVTEILWKLIITEWYQKENNYHISRLYYPIWIENYHKSHIVEKYMSEEEIKNFKWFRDQACFCVSHPKIEMKKIISYKKFKELIRLDEITFDACKKGLTRYVYKVDVSKNNLTYNYLSVPGVFECVPISENVKVDMSKTLVTFIYNLGRKDRPMDVYMKSLQKIAKLLYPIVFFGEKDVCDEFMKYRGELSIYTIAITRKMEDWELFRDYPPEEIESDNLDRSKSEKYSKMTSSKIWAIEKAISLNAFPSDTYIWMDGGIYKYNLPPKFEDDLELLRNLNPPIDKIIVESLSQGSGTSHEDYEKGEENIITAIIAGGKEGWNCVLPPLKKLIRSKFDEKKFHDEQKTMSRFDALYPDYFIRKYAGYDYMTMIHFLDL